MNGMSEKQQTRFGRVVTALLPLAFIGSGWLNVMAFVLDGHRHGWFRQGFVLGIQALAAVLALGYLAGLYRREPGCRPTIWRAALIPGVFVCLYAGAMVWHPEKSMLLRQLVIDGGYLAFAWCAVLILALERRVEPFLRAFRVYGAALGPVMVYYCVRFYVSDLSAPADLGVLSYMPLAYLLLVFCLVLMGSRLLEQKARPAVRGLEFGLYVLFAAAITLSGTKGAILCLLFGAGLLALYPWFARRPKGGYLLWAGAAAAVVVLFSTVCFPAALGSSRTEAIVQELSGEQTEGAAGVTAQAAGVLERLGEPAGDEELILFVRSGEAMRALEREQISKTEYDTVRRAAYLLDGTVDSVSLDWQAGDLQKLEELLVDLDLLGDGTVRYGEIVPYVDGGAAWAALEAGGISRAEYELLWTASYKLNQTAGGARMLLWRNALRAMRENPLTGHGPMWYQLHYGTYPHNLFLEIGADLGVPVMVFVLLLGLCVFLWLLRWSVVRPGVAAAALYVMAQIPQDMISGSCYSSGVFVKYGFSILLAGYLWTRRSALRTKRGDMD